ncbi:hypothetical protein BX600DRAFT_438221 [Xylariales sp. PMI_506]|nr:hypothetical protein BX600DRAFT_438221 [Xylariales sp. PMI_506]
MGLPAGGLTAFYPNTFARPIIIAGFGFTTTQSMLFNMASGICIVASIFLALFISKYQTVPLYNGARYGGYILINRFSIAPLFVISRMTAGIAGSTKKFAFGVAYQLGLAVGTPIQPRTYQAKDAPNYYPAKYTMLAFFVLTFFFLLALGLHLFWNMRRDKRDAAASEGKLEPELIPPMTKTDTVI